LQPAYLPIHHQLFKIQGPHPLHDLFLGLWTNSHLRFIAHVISWSLILFLT